MSLVRPLARPLVRALPHSLIKGRGFTGPFDALPASYGAVSLNRLYRSYDGPLVRLRRSSDSAEQDFSAVSGRLDAAAVSAWRGGGDAVIRTWYDQTGNSRHAQQATGTKQAKLSADCRTAIFDGVNDDYVLDNSLAFGRAVSGLTGAMFASILDKTTVRVMFQAFTPVPNTRFRALKNITSGEFGIQSRRLDADSAVSTFGGSDVGELIHRYIARRDYAGATATRSVDGVLTTSAAGTAGTTSDTSSLTGVSFGSSGSADYLKGECVYFGLFQSAIDDEEMSALDAAMLRLVDDFDADFDPNDFA